MNLLEQVKNTTTARTTKNSKVDPEQLELALAWLRGEVQSNKMSAVLFERKLISSRYNYYAWLFKLLRHAYDHGMISTSEVSKG